jgi:hypothetical protein
MAAEEVATISVVTMDAAITSLRPTPETFTALELFPSRC